MGKKKDMNRKGHGKDNNGNKVEEVGDNSMHRAPSVEDLFAPLSGLNVHATGETRHYRVPEAPSVTKHGAASSSGAPASRSVSPESEGGSGSAAKPPVPTSLSSASGSAANEPPQLSKPAEAETIASAEEGSQQQGASGKDTEPSESMGGNAASPQANQLSPTGTADDEISPISSGSLSGSLSGLSSGSGSGTGSGGALHILSSGKGEADAALPPSQSTTDDEQLTGAALDERKHKRMLSNRESARRSRLRKQQHLDELRAQVAHLRAENTDMMAKYNVASQQYTQITSDNVVLRAQAMELDKQLQQAQIDFAAHQRSKGPRSHGVPAGPVDRFPAGAPTSYVQSRGTDVPK